MRKTCSSLLIAVFVTALMAGVPSAVFAGQWNNFTTALNGDTETYAVQNVDKTQMPGKILCYGMSDGIDLAVSDTLSATVGGAVFNTKFFGLLNATNTGATTHLGPGLLGAISVLNNTTTVSTYRVTTDGADLTGIAAAADVGNFMLGNLAAPVGGAWIATENAIFDLTGLTVGAYVSLQMDIQTQLGVAIDSTPVSYNIIQGINEADVTTETASATIIIDVASSKMRVINAAGAKVLVADAGAYTVTDNAADIDDKTCVINKILYTITGDMSAVTTITSAGVTSSTAAGVLGTGPGVGGWWVDTANGKAYAVNTAALNNGALALAPVVTFDGTTVIPEGSYTIQATYLGDPLIVAWTLDPTPFAFLSLAYNGTIAYSGMLVGTGNTGWGGGFRLVNRSAFDANVYFQAQAVGGGAWSADVLYGTQIPAGESIYVSADTVFATCGLPITTTGNAIISVEAPHVDVFQTATTPSGHTIIPLTKPNNQVYN